jgi:hypothetical protein
LLATELVRETIGLHAVGLAQVERVGRLLSNVFAGRDCR